MIILRKERKDSIEVNGTVRYEDQKKASDEKENSQDKRKIKLFKLKSKNHEMFKF